MQTSKKARNRGKMLQISAFKLAIANGQKPFGMSAKKAEKIKQQVAKRLQEQKTVGRYTPFTSRSPSRRPRQVGA